ncbi:sensor histidine kinase [Streptomyces triticirhizae]|uniref:Histidine kinase/HSP90-like ATPase domain-containing protein n=1 Tax=Streptomyces triticirhizae TaxID=2483353 RepID=A0A3M2M6V5_9ACTN|nr:ATP-binding protein [Streptomyces triticirhizae]RMI45189.1 hypothetical protein EBN88_03925 [Streptomyces triticirhizae]
MGNYAAELERTASPLARDTGLLNGCLTQAEYVLDDCVRALRTGEVHLDVTNLPRVDLMADKFVTHQLQPGDYLEASHVFVEVASVEVQRVLLDTACPADLREVATRTLVRGAARRTRFLAGFYDAASLDTIDEIRLLERRSLARDVHDGIGNGLTLALRLVDGALGRGGEPAELASRLRRARQVLLDTLSQAQEVICQLRRQDPALGIFEALRMFRDHAGCGTTAVDLRLSGDDWRVPDTSRKEIYLILCEALRNALAHAEAERVTVTVTVADTEVVAEVADDGCGFDLTPPGAGGYGLRSMSDRAALLGGTCRVFSEVGVGTRVRLGVPLRGE